MANGERDDQRDADRYRYLLAYMTGFKRGKHAEPLMESLAGTAERSPFSPAGEVLEDYREMKERLDRKAKGEAA